MKLIYKLIVCLIIISAVFSCRGTYDYRGNSDGRWVPNLETSHNEKSTRSYEKSALAKTEVQKINEEISANNSMPIVSSVSRDTLFQKETKKAEQLEKRLTDLTVKTAHLIPTKINRVISKKAESKIPGFLTYKCRSLGMTIGYRIMVYGLLILVFGGFLLLIAQIHDSIWYEFWVYSIMVSAIAILVMALGFLIWLFSLIITAFTQ